MSMSAPRPKLRVAGFRDYEIMVELNKCEMRDCEHPGSDVEYLKLVLQLADIEYEYVPGNFYSDELIEMICNGTADISISALQVNLERLKCVSFTNPLYYGRTGYGARETKEMSNGGFAGAGISITIYLLVTATVLITAFMLSCIRRIEQRFFKTCKMPYLDLTFCVFSNFFNQRPMRSHRFVAAFIMSASWLCFAFFGVQFFQSSLKSYFISKKQLGYTFNSFVGVLDAIEYGQWIGIEPIGGYKFGEFCRDPLECQRVEKLENGGKIVSVAQQDVDAHLNLGHYVVVVEAVGVTYPHAADYTDRSSDQIFIGDDSYPPVPLAFAVSRKYGRLLERLNQAIALTSGFYVRIRTHYTSVAKECVSRVETNASRLTLKVASLRLPFVICSVLLLLASAVIVIESLVNSVRNRCRNHGVFCHQR